MKMREAEASLSLKEMRQRLADMEQQWLKYMQSRAHPQYFQASSSTTSLDEISAQGADVLPASVESVVHVDALEGGTSASQQHSPTSSSGASSGNATATTTTAAAAPSAPQRARERLAKFTASLMGAAGTITGSTSQQSVEESESGLSIRDLEDQFMGLKIREADTMAELKEMRQKVMEMETQVL